MRATVLFSRRAIMSKQCSYDAVVVGSGPNGLAAAIRTVSAHSFGWPTRGLNSKLGAYLPRFRLWGTTTVVIAGSERLPE